MKNLYKYILLAVAFLASIFAIFHMLDTFSEKGVELQKKILIKQAQTHYYAQINTRRWNAQFGGVYVKPIKGIQVNPYLKNNSLKVDENLTLVKINPAWMTRQLSEISDMKDFHFRITSLKPINPRNEADEFETRALQYIEKTGEKEYYEISDNNRFNYMGALVTTQDCLTCHQEQGYVLGDIRGGISISLDSSEYQFINSSIKSRVLLLKIFILLLLLLIAILIYKQLKNNEDLQINIDKRTKEILSTKRLLQEVLNADLSFLIVADGTQIIFTNKRILDFFNVETLDEFREKHQLISNSFEEVNDDDFLTPFIDSEHWIDYLQREQTNRDLKILMIKDGVKRYFKPHSTEVIIDNKELHIIIFDEITSELKNIEFLKDEASKDALTKLFNRGRFDEVLEKEIALSKTTQHPLSLIFLDIDHFKIVNDTYGHDVGDIVLVELAHLLTDSVRKGDFVARWGGEEFVITLQATDVQRAFELATKIRKRVESYDFSSGTKQTISLGVTQYIENEDEKEFLQRVDRALYSAKASGRNRVVSL